MPCLAPSWRFRLRFGKLLRWQVAGSNLFTMSVDMVEMGFSVRTVTVHECVCVQGHTQTVPIVEEALASKSRAEFYRCTSLSLKRVNRSHAHTRIASHSI